MGLWAWDGEEWRKQCWCRDERPGRCVIYGSGPSLKTAPNIPGAFRLVQNHAARFVEPHLWVGLDDPALYDYIAYAPFRRVYRGNYADNLVDGIPARRLPDSYFADVKEMSPISIFEQKGIDAAFMWNKNTLAFAVQMALWLGFRVVSFAGIDLKGAYADGRELSEVDRLDCEKLWDEQLAFMKWLAERASARQIRVTCLSPESRLATVMPVEVV
jgi:hypothetical protein